MKRKVWSSIIRGAASNTIVRELVSHFCMFLSYRSTINQIGVSEVYPLYSIRYCICIQLKQQKSRPIFFTVPILCTVYCTGIPGYCEIRMQLCVESVDLNLSREGLMVHSVFRACSSWFTPVNVQLLHSEHRVQNSEPVRPGSPQ